MSQESTELFVLSAASDDALVAELSRFAAFLDRVSGVSLLDVAYTASLTKGPSKIGIVASDVKDLFARILSAYKEDGFDRVNPSILKSAVQAVYPDFTERQVGLRRFSDVLRALEKEHLLALETDEGGNMLVHIL